MLEEFYILHPWSNIIGVVKSGSGVYGTHGGGGEKCMQGFDWKSLRTQTAGKVQT